MFLVQGLLAVHVLSGPGSVDGGRAMPVRPGCDQYGVDVVPFQKVTEVAVGGTIVVAVFCIGRHFDGFAADLLHITDGHELDVGLLEEASEVVGSAVADADASEDDSFAGGDGSAHAEGRAGDQVWGGQ